MYCIVYFGKRRTISSSLCLTIYIYVYPYGRIRPAVYSCCVHKVYLQRTWSVLNSWTWNSTQDIHNIYISSMFVVHFSHANEVCCVLPAVNILRNNPVCRKYTGEISMLQVHRMLAGSSPQKQYTACTQHIHFSHANEAGVYYPSGVYAMYSSGVCAVNRFCCVHVAYRVLAYMPCTPVVYVLWTSFAVVK